eukprot:CAMPEP_0174738386 /NCGR_PEP_ID=MMETSP1094-20130205/69858_1 /TAXON_ID=156173 /ORGANISM="Chrysochromulina brevifilum, Strain UTEX LB 985" /LENGTH=109 /DNA_ID=CAMNT_0015941785 /DNA_START=82 /DNA_END=411 /DNA_ORIENTATION=-
MTESRVDEFQDHCCLKGLSCTCSKVVVKFTLGLSAFACQLPALSHEDRLGAMAMTNVKGLCVALQTCTGPSSAALLSTLLSVVVLAGEGIEKAGRLSSVERLNDMFEAR